MPEELIERMNGCHPPRAAAYSAARCEAARRTLVIRRAPVCEDCGTDMDRACMTTGSAFARCRADTIGSSSEPCIEGAA